MINESNPNPPAPSPTEPEVETKPERARIAKQPGLIAVSCYMLLLAEAAVVYVVQGRAGPLYLVLAAMFIAAGLGLLFLLRWAWALSLAAVTLAAGWYLWSFSTEHSSGFLVRGSVNLVIFLYLMRPAVRTKLR
ncbi:MAG: hypothetical protein WBP85_05195 [Terracidiphilus sp.]